MFATDAITATTIAADAIGASELAAGAVSEIQAGLSSYLASVIAKTDTLPASPAATGASMTLTTAYDFAQGTTAMTEAYAADGATVTPVQMLHMIYAALAQFVVCGTAISAFKLDGTTHAMTFTTDNATTPTQRIRSN